MQSEDGKFEEWKNVECEYQSLAQVNALKRTENNVHQLAVACLLLLS